MKIPIKELPLPSDTKKVFSVYKNLGGLLENYITISRAEGAPGYNVPNVWYLLNSLLFTDLIHQKRYCNRLSKRTKEKIDAYVKHEV